MAAGAEAGGGGGEGERADFFGLLTCTLFFAERLALLGWLCISSSSSSSSRCPLLAAGPRFFVERIVLGASLPLLGVPAAAARLLVVGGGERGLRLRVTGGGEKAFLLLVTGGGEKAAVRLPLLPVPCA